MKSMWPSSAAIFFIPYFYRDGGPSPPLRIRYGNLAKTRMHSSGMRTTCLLTISQHALWLGVPAGGCICQGVPACGGNVPAWGGVPAMGVYLHRGVCTCQGGTCPRGVYLPGGYLPKGGVPARGVPAQVLPPTPP